MRLPTWLRLAPLAIAAVACRSDSSAASAAPLLRLVQRPPGDNCAYVSAAGDTVIPFGRYSRSETPLFDKVAVVLKPQVGWVGIDRHERVLYHLFNYDNGPDYPAEGVRRIQDAASRIGFADSASGHVVLVPQYEAAFPFAQGRAQVGSCCQVLPDGEHWLWSCAEWHYIDHQGRVASAPTAQE
jgi:hypothetical protein